MVEAGEVTPVMDRAYSLSETTQAMGHVGGGHTRGKIAITVQAQATSLTRVA
jgi:NADPH:quinone reductase-like Zn-dependent oxidoreductase